MLQRLVPSRGPPPVVRWAFVHSGAAVRRTRINGRRHLRSPPIAIRSGLSHPRRVGCA
jgi:hypothetical protein